ncbi:MAG: hypothetical protein O9264_11645 [Leptospira sp.]|nr:hypothetical protein [Leptospira sp.]
MIRSKERDSFFIPSKIQMAREVMGIVDAAKLVFHLPELLKKPKGNGERIIVLPGFATDDIFMLPLRSYLQNLGYAPEGWGLGHNHGDVPVILDLFNEKIRKIYAETKESIILIGWSLGGYIARESARDNQNIVTKVITLGSPVIGGPKYTSIADIYSKKQKIDIDQLEKEIDERFENPINIPIYSIYSKEDNVVSWQACIDSYSPNVTNYEVDSTHIGLIVNSEVYGLIAKYLSEK